LSTALVLTQQGEQSALNIQSRGPEYTVLSTLYEAGGPVDFDEIMNALHSDEVKASLIVRRLINQGDIKEL
jgi:predicted transcriptional regulator